MTDAQPRRRRSGREWMLLFIVLLVGAVTGAAIWAAFGSAIAAAEAAEPPVRETPCRLAAAPERNAAGAR